MIKSLRITFFHALFEKLQKRRAREREREKEGDLYGGWKRGVVGDWRMWTSEMEG